MKKTFEEIRIGDELPSITKEETVETITNYMKIPRGNEEISGDEAYFKMHASEHSADTVLAGMSNAGTATVGYVSEMLEAFFPVSSLLRGSSLEVKATEVVRPGDTIITSGKVINKEVRDGKRMVFCEVYVKNQKGTLVAVGTANVAF